MVRWRHLCTRRYSRAGRRPLTAEAGEGCVHAAKRQAPELGCQNAALRQATFARMTI